MAFFEQLGKRLTDTGQNVARQTKNLADVTQLNSAIADKEKKISQLMLSIGQSYYERHKDDETAEEPEKMDAIRTLYEEIAENREKIKQIKGVVQCGNCGAEVPADAMFCSACGAKVETGADSAEEPEPGRRCPNCHAVVADGDLFCNRCGTRMETKE